MLQVARMTHFTKQTPATCISGKAGGKSAWFRNRDGSRYGTLGLAFASLSWDKLEKRAKWLTTHPEARHAWADGPINV